VPPGPSARDPNAPGPSAPGPSARDPNVRGERGRTEHRVGWLGGSFDPVHEGHLQIARLAADAFGLERVLFVPAGHPPHKRDRALAPAADRLALLALACRADSRFVPHDVELRRDGLSYSYDTARELLAELPPDSRLYAIIGADTLADLPTWHRIRELAALVQFCPVTRAGQPLQQAGIVAALGAEAAASIARHALDVPAHPASSTAIRAALARGERPQWLPPGVEAELRRRGLYGAGGASSSDSSGVLRSRP
jgi:nicotinate-nucleotide adenylyltransferase